MKTDSLLFYFTSMLITISIVFSMSLSVFTVLVENVSHYHFFIRQFIFGIFSIFLIWLISLIKVQYLTYIAITVLIASAIAMLSMLFLPSSMVSVVKGASRWIKFPFFNIAPTEFFKIGFIYFIAWSFAKKLGDEKKNMWQEGKLLFPYIMLFLPVAFFIAFIQNDLGQVVVLGVVLLFMSLFAGTSFKLIIASILSLSFLATIFIITSDYRIARVKSWWGGIQDLVLSYLPANLTTKLHIEDAAEPYQVKYSLNAINNGELFGQGLGLGNFKLGYLSEVHTDFILAGITEEIGLIGVLGVIFIYIAILFRIFKIASRSIDKTYQLFCLGIGFLLMFSLIINSYGITSIMPVKGIAVPFLSYGGSNLLASSIAIGFVLMISKRARL